MLTIQQKTELTKAIGGLEKWRKQCHQASLALIRTGRLSKGARVARGTHTSVMGQHSWVCVGDPYDTNVLIIDPTIWDYMGEPDPQIIEAPAYALRHMPFGSGTIWEYGRPPPPVAEPIELDAEWSGHARAFFELIGHPLDRAGWKHLAHAPIGGWPAAEILGAMYDDDRTSALIPIDIVGMATDRNPGELYW